MQRFAMLKPKIFNSSMNLGCKGRKGGGGGKASTWQSAIF